MSFSTIYSLVAIAISVWAYIDPSFWLICSAVVLFMAIPQVIMLDAAIHVIESDKI